MDRYYSHKTVIFYSGVPRPYIHVRYNRLLHLPSHLSIMITSSPALANTPQLQVAFGEPDDSHFLYSVLTYSKRQW